MQFLRIFFKGLFIALAVGLVAFFGGRELYVFYVRWGVLQSVNDIQNLVAFPGQYHTRCAEEFSNLGIASGLNGFQIRFLDEKNYAIEAVCAYDTTKPIVIKKQTLPMFSKKLPGSSGILINIGSPAPSQFRLDILGRTTAVVLEQKSDVLEDTSAVYPISVCAGWGYQCCNAETEVAKKDVVTADAIDCPQSCAPVCQKRPLIYSFNAAPSYNALTRTVNARSNAIVDFAYVIGDADGSITRATIDFGDGNVEDVPTQGSGRAEHSYLCPSSTCTYTAKLLLIDNADLNSLSNQTSQIRVVVSGR